MFVTYYRCEYYESHFNHSINQAIENRHFLLSETRFLKAAFLKFFEYQLISENNEDDFFFLQVIRYQFFHSNR